MCSYKRECSFDEKHRQQQRSRRFKKSTRKNAIPLEDLVRKSIFQVLLTDILNMCYYCRDEMRAGRLLKHDRSRPAPGFLGALCVEVRTDTGYADGCDWLNTETRDTNSACLLFPGALNPVFRAPKPLPLLIPSDFVTKRGFPL